MNRSSLLSDALKKDTKRLAIVRCRRQFIRQVGLAEHDSPSVIEKNEQMVNDGGHRYPSIYRMAPSRMSMRDTERPVGCFDAEPRIW